MHVSPTLDAELQRLTISLRQWKAGVTARDVCHHYETMLKELGTSRDEIFQCFVDPEGLPRSCSEERAGIVRRNRGYLRYLASMDFVCQYDEQNFSNFMSKVKCHLFNLEQQMKLPTYNNLDGAADLKEGDDFDL